MKKFEEEIFGKVETMITQPGCSMTRKAWYSAGDIHDFSEGWVSPEDHATGIVKWKHENQRLRTLLDAAGESSKELLDINKKLRGDLGDAQGKLRGSGDYIKELKDQLEKRQPEIPEFVANYIEAAKEDFWTLLSAMDDPNLSSRVGDWLKGGNFNNQEIFAQAWINGYTVAKEKRFYLKHKSVLVFDPDMEDSDVEELYLGAGGNFVPYQHLAKIFIQSQIDSMETGSYEQIEVEE